MEDEIWVQIEIPHGSNVKYEIHNHRLICDRFLHGPFLYPFNYGSIQNTLGGDGDPLDAIVLTRRPLIPTCYIRCRIIGALLMEDEKGLDEKIILVPHESIDPYSTHIVSIENIDSHSLDEIEYFFRRYKDMEKHKFSTVKEFVDSTEAWNLYQKYKIDSSST